MFNRRIADLVKYSIIEHNHSDYKEKQIFINITDKYGDYLENKIVIKVHKDLDIKQEEYRLDICFQECEASLLMNSKEQSKTEKLKFF